MYVNKLKRFTQKIFGLDSGDKEMVEFGTPTEGRPIFIDKMQDPAAVQTKYYEQGWFPESLTGNIRPYAEDMNGVHFLHSYQLAYILQAGIPEWDSNTPYFKDCICRKGAVLYISIKDSINQGNDPISSAGAEFWNVFTLGDTGIPVGASLEWNGMEVPNDKWHFEDGTFFDISEEYDALYQVIGKTFGSRTITRNGVQVEQFAIPNSTGRVALGYKSGDNSFALGNSGGQFNHQHFVPAHSHGKGSLNIIASGDHSHTLVDNGHSHAIGSHNHHFRFGDYSAAAGSGVGNLANLGSAGQSGTSNDPTTINWDRGPKSGKEGSGAGRGFGHFYKGTSYSELGTQASRADISCQSQKHVHRSESFAGVVGNPSAPSADNGNLLTKSSNDASSSSNMPYIVKRKIIRIKP